MEKANSENCDISCDDRKKVFDVSHIHFKKTMSEISKLRSRSLLFDIQINSDGRTFQVINMNRFNEKILM